MITCQCPQSAALQTIPASGCPESFGQIQKVAFQRISTDAGEKNGFTAQAAIGVKASWTALMAAADSSKIVISPYIQAPATEAGAARTFGGGNETLGGVEQIIGREPTAFTGIIRSVKQEIIKAMKPLQCEAVNDNLGVYLFDENGNICAVKGTAEGQYYPIPIRAFFVGDKSFGGLEEPDSNAIQWSFLPNYSDDLAIVAPTDFNPLTDLKPAQ